MNDSNSNGTVDDSGEVVLVAPIPTGVETKSIAVAGTGDVWFEGGSDADGTSDLYSVHAGSAAIAFDAATLMQAGLQIQGRE